MKKIVFMFVIILAIAATVSAQNYTVQEVTGRVEKETGGKWAAVKAGETIRGDEVIRTVIGASLTVKSGEKVSVVGPMKNGKLSDLASGSSAIQIQGKVSQTDTEALSRNTGRVSTASARASEAAGEIEIAE